MKIARMALPTGERALGLVDGETVQILEGVGESDILRVCMDRDGATWSVGRSFDATAVRFLPPVATPPSVRDFMAFEAHVRTCTEGTGGKMHAEWWDRPVFYFSNPRAIVGDRDPVAAPRGSRSLDYELELACIIGVAARDIDAASPSVLDCVAGFTLMNDWSARDLAAKEMKHGLGPAKGKDFATSIGPWVVTPDEVVTPDGVVDVPLTAAVNGRVRSAGRSGDMSFDWAQILERASADTWLLPGDVIGSGTVGTGCLLELRISQGRDANPWLAPGDEVELASPLFGRLRNPIVDRCA